MAHISGTAEQWSFINNTSKSRLFFFFFFFASAENIVFIAKSLVACPGRFQALVVQSNSGLRTVRRLLVVTVMASFILC